MDKVLFDVANIMAVIIALPIIFSACYVYIKRRMTNRVYCTRCQYRQSWGDGVFQCHRPLGRKLIKNYMKGDCRKGLSYTNFSANKDGKCSFYRQGVEIWVRILLFSLFFMYLVIIWNYVT